MEGPLSFADLVKSRGAQDKVPFYDMTIQHFERIGYELMLMNDAIVNISQNPPVYLKRSLDILKTVYAELRPLILEKDLRKDATGKEVTIKELFDKEKEELKDLIQEYYEQAAEETQPIMPSNELVNRLENFRDMLLQEVQEVVGIRRGHRGKLFGEFDSDKEEPR